MLCSVKIVSGELVLNQNLIKGQLLYSTEMCPSHLPFPHCHLGLPHVGSSSSEEGLHKNVKSMSISQRKKLQVVLESLSCSSTENGDKGGKLGTNWMGRTAKQVQTKVEGRFVKVKVSVSRLTKERSAPARCTTGNVQRGKRKLQSITGGTLC